jgi:hypothetical protein
MASSKRGSVGKSSPLTTNGLLMPSDFPVEAYESVHGVVVAARGSDAQYHHYAGAWNAVAYRFLGATDSGAAFIESVRAHGTTPNPPERYLQERTLFEFFSSGFSVFEAAFFALYTFGAFLAPGVFKLATARDQQRVTPSRTKEAYETAFQSDSILPVLDALFVDPGYQWWRELRNILTHRAAPGRRIYVSLGNDDALPVEWKLNNQPFNESLVTNGREELARLSTTLLDGTLEFIQRRLK